MKSKTKFKQLFLITNIFIFIINVVNAQVGDTVYLSKTHYYISTFEKYTHQKQAVHYKYFASQDTFYKVCDTAWWDVNNPGGDQILKSPSRISKYNEGVLCYNEGYSPAFFEYEDDKKTGSMSHQFYYLIPNSLSVRFNIHLASRDEVKRLAILYNEKLVITYSVHSDRSVLKGGKFSYLDKASFVFDEDGNMQYIIDVTTGHFISFYPDHSVKEKGKYKNGKKVGVWKEFYLNGELKSMGEYYPEVTVDYLVYSKKELDSLLHLPNVEAVVDSIPQYTYWKHGKWQYWNEKGKLIKEEFWEKGKLLREKEY